MLRFAKAITFLPMLKSNILVSFNSKTCGLDVLVFSEFIYIVSIFYTLMDLIMLHTFLVICLDWYKDYTICIISFNKLSELLPAFTCASAIGNLWSIYLGVSILSSEWLDFKMPVPLDFIGNILLSNASRTFSLPSKILYKFSRTISFSCFFFYSLVSHIF